MPEENGKLFGENKPFEENKSFEENKPFEENMSRLELLVRQLERGELSLEDALACYQEGVALVRFCQQSLERTAKEVEILTEGLQQIQDKPISGQRVSGSHMHGANSPNTDMDNPSSSGSGIFNNIIPGNENRQNEGI